MNTGNNSLKEAFRKRYNEIEAGDEEDEQENRSWANLSRAKRIVSGAADVKAGSAERDNDRILSGLRQMGII